MSYLNLHNIIGVIVALFPTKARHRLNPRMDLKSNYAEEGYCVNGTVIQLKQGKAATIHQSQRR